MNAIRFGVLGAARIVPHALLAPARAAEGVSVVAIAARSGARAQEFARATGIARAYDDYAALLEDPEVNAVYVPLPNSLHARWAIAALKAGKHVLCEKPLAANTAQAEAVAQAARQAGRICMEAFHWRYHPLAARLIELARDPSAGAMRTLRARFCTPMLRRDDIRFHYDLGGGATMDLGCYLVSLLRAVADEEPVVDWARATLLRPNVDKTMRARLHFPGGVVAELECEMAAWRWPTVDLRVECARRTLTAVNPVLPQIHHELRVRDAGGSRREWFGRTPTYTYQMQAFAHAVRTGAPPLTSADDGVRNMQVIDALYQAAGLPVRGLSIP